MTMCVRLGNIPGNDWKVFRPMMMQCPDVSALNLLKSRGKCHNSLLSLPSALFCAAAATSTISFFLSILNGNLAFDVWMRLISLESEIFKLKTEDVLNIGIDYHPW